MLRSFIMILALAGSMWAQSLQAELTNTIKKYTKQDFAITEIIPLENKNFSIAILKTQEMFFPLLVTNDGKLATGLTSVFFTENTQDYNSVLRIYKETTSYNENLKNKPAIEALLKDLGDKSYITLKSNTKTKEYTYIIADPNCGFCQQELATFDDRLKSSNLVVILVAILGEDSAKRSALIYNKIKKNDTNKQKLAVLEKYFNPKTKIGDVNTKFVEQITQKVQDSKIIPGTPFIFRTIQ